MLACMLHCVYICIYIYIYKAFSSRKIVRAGWNLHDIPQKRIHTRRSNDKEKTRLIQ
jgi:hypothetical protein